MRVSTNTIASLSMPLREKIKMLAEAGFDCYDISLFSGNDQRELDGDDYREKAASIRAYADLIGITCNQAHAPFGGIYGDPDNEEGFSAVLRSMEIAAILGAPIIVVHPIQHLNYAEYHEELFEMNLVYYRRLIPYAEKLGIKIATENMWQNNCGARVPTDSVCSRPREFCRMIDELDSPYLVGCLDLGHAALMGADVPAFIRAMGKDRLRALHVHDVDFVHDLHTLPYLSKMDFAPICEALGEIGYEGDLTFEASNFYQRFPLPLIPAATRMMYETGKYLAAEIERARK